MSNPVSSVALRKIRPIAIAPDARQVIFEIGMLLAAHLLLALAITTMVQSFADI